MGDAISFTFGGTVDPSLILSGWDGSAKAVTVRIQGNGPNDALTVLDSVGSALAQLGQVDLAGNYANGTLLDFTASQMTLSGSTVTIVLGTRSGTAHHHTTPTTMVWTNPEGTAIESGPADVEF
jgi:hypothetical protein